MRLRLTLPRLSLIAAFVLTIALSAYAQTISQPTHTVKIDFNQRVRMRDGVELSADVYRPDAAGQYPVILSRTPYIKTSNSTLAIARDALRKTWTRSIGRKCTGTCR